MEQKNRTTLLSCVQLRKLFSNMTGKEWNWTGKKKHKKIEMRSKDRKMGTETGCRLEKTTKIKLYSMRELGEEWIYIFKEDEKK